MAAIIEIEDVTKRFGDFEVLRGVNLTVEGGRTLCILGCSGGGKSTLMKIMIGALRPTSGRVIVDGDDITRMSEKQLNEVRRKFGVMFQGGALLDSMTVAKNIALPVEYHYNHDAETVRYIVKIKLNQVGLLEAGGKLPSELSGGMIKRAAIARALALDPDILFYDEPSAGLDPITTTRIDGLINELRDAMGMTNVVVTHVMESVARIADHVIMLDAGRVILDGSLDDLERSEDPRVQQFRTGDLGDRGERAISADKFLEDLLM